jgi:class 3 adenylate cyclase/YHS domain-containing protein
METNIAIMMADLSGYSALTEVHGAEMAADLVGQYMNIVNRSLVGNSRFQERAGDQVMIISSSAEQLAYTAIILFEQVHEQEHFLALHAGLHYGPVVEKHGHFFGSTINAAARIMAGAPKGKIFCSAEFVKELPSTDSFSLDRLGSHQFKNLMQQIDVYDLTSSKHISSGYVIDPICHMLIRQPQNAVQLTIDGQLHYFCSEKCRDIFQSMHDAVDRP